MAEIFVVREKVAPVTLSRAGVTSVSETLNRRLVRGFGNCLIVHGIHYWFAADVDEISLVWSDNVVSGKYIRVSMDASEHAEES